MAVVEASRRREALASGLDVGLGYLVADPSAPHQQRAPWVRGYLVRRLAVALREPV
jgi:hypothetical protein